MVILGSTGSIGVNSLEICRRFHLPVEALCAGENLTLLQEQIDEFAPKIVAIADSKRVHEIRHPHVLSGAEGILELLRRTKSETVVNALVGFAGLAPTLLVQEQNRRLALANKESLVIAGAFLDPSRIVPIDSEHFGLWYLLHDRPVHKMFLTASGGAFRDWEIDAIHHASYAQALRHPNWSMGKKITIDSASMVNKLFELLEAKWLFGSESIDAVIERNSFVHALIEFQDGSTTAHLANLDMKLPIAYALGCPIEEPVIPPLDLLKIGTIRFEEISSDRYPLWSIKESLLRYPKSGVVLNAANEAAMCKFEQGVCNFGTMCQKILAAYEHFYRVDPKNIEELFSLDHEVRSFVDAQ